MNQDKAPLASQEQPDSPAGARSVTIEVCGAENIITIVARPDSVMQDSYSFAGVNQKVTVSLPPGTRLAVNMTGADNQVLVSKELTVAHFDSTGADNQLDYLADQ